MPKLQLAQLPATGGSFFGRENELAALESAWNDLGTKVVCIIGPGGIGKTSLVNHWLSLRASEGYRDIDQVFAWSFYDSPSSAEFFAQCLRFFDMPFDPSRPTEQVHLLINALQSSRTLLVLDGFERLQESEERRGWIHDVLIREFIIGVTLLPHNDSFCIITSRLQIPEITDLPSVTTLVLGPLDDLAGFKLLKALGTIGTDEEIKAAIHEYEGHPLALQLLGSYLREYQSGDVRQRATIDDTMLSKLKKPSLSFDIWVDPGTAAIADIEELFQSISALARAYGGSGLVFVEGDDIRIHSMEASTK